METILRYFPALTEQQIKQIGMLQEVYTEWNSKINVISRKDLEELYLRHVLHSLTIAKIINFKPGTKILDIGTGGGFPGIPLAIMFPETHFHLVDSIGKKIKVVEAVCGETGLKNVKAENIRAENIKDSFDFVVSRAVTTMDKFIPFTKGKILKQDKNSLPNGIIALKGGDLTDELKSFGKKVTVYDIADFFKEPFFETKKIIHLPM